MDEDQTPLNLEKGPTSNLLFKAVTVDKPAGEDAKSSRENGEVWSNGVTEANSDRNVDKPLALDEKPSKSRSFYSSHNSLFVLTASYRIGILSDIDEQETKHESYPVHEQEYEYQSQKEQKP